jgi:hypothetical protein
VREVNNETGDWQIKTHRHIDLDAVSSSTVNAIERLTTQVNGSLKSLDANFVNRYNENVHDSKASY